ncbi:hypothetical protein BEN49_08325 [Hymenobacter coccineus]|uniref:Uncharacterized protein n=1 Tax=Hymenobacter coccineus TaxID=1908235 RepID=A0A1G1TFW0_9BACT|nr:hypothetical protein BEN49_08325 [Hymenobacter coccineus]
MLRAHRRRVATPEELPIEWLSESNYEVKKLGLAPWAVSEKPPLVIRQLWVGRLVADFQAWRQGLMAHYPDFYLAVWIHEPEFGRSQLVAGIDARQTRYEGLFDRPVNVSFPSEYYSVPGVGALHWTAYADGEPFWPDEFAELGPLLLQRAHWEAKSDDGKPFFVVQTGVVWVGRAAAA